MVEKKSIKISAEPKTIINLYDNEVLTLEESKESLEQFTKNELIDTLLVNSEDFNEDYDEEDEFDTKAVVEPTIEEDEDVKEVIDDDGDDDFKDF